MTARLKSDIFTFQQQVVYRFDSLAGDIFSLMHDVILEFKQDALELKVSQYFQNNQMVLQFHANQSGLWLHWGLLRTKSGRWQQPALNLCPVDSRLLQKYTVQSPLSQQDAQGFYTTLCVDKLSPTNEPPFSFIAFVFYRESEDSWIKPGRDNFMLALGQQLKAQQALAAWRNNLPSDIWRTESLSLSDDSQLSWAVCDQSDTSHCVVLKIASELAGPLLLHWGVNGRRSRQWQLPAEAWRPNGSKIAAATAVQTPFKREGELNIITLRFPIENDEAMPDAISCVLHNPRDNIWLKSKRGDIRIKLRNTLSAATTLLLPESVAEKIIEAETNHSSWTLMHRFNLAYDLLDEAQGESDALSLIYIWLRFSALRQLDWQRRYNTQPRELGHAQDRLTHKLAEIYLTEAASPVWVRLILSTLGHGGNGQRVRDEILEIMHRHHIKEAHGHFMEEWHQKLHNNTTPDDVVICEAYLTFLKEYGNVGRFYDILAKNGVTKQRLESFDRPIRSDPEYYGDKRDGLIHDFEHYLRTLKAVHRGADFDTAWRYVRHLIPEDQKHAFHQLFDHGLATQDRLNLIVQVRGYLQQQLNHPAASNVRLLLFMDLALEQSFRNTVEASQLGQLPFEALLDLLRVSMAQLTFDENTQNQLSYQACLDHLHPLLARPERDSFWALELRSVCERVAGIITAWSDSMVESLQPKAEQLGEELGIEAWVLTLFAEEVIRGAPPFVVSLILKQLDPMIRQQAGIRGWQIISPGTAIGEVVVAPSLQAIQTQSFEKNTIILTDRVAGTEEIPAGVTSVITTDQPDLVSHVAVRARNAKVLLASCFEIEIYEKLKQAAGQLLTLKVTPAGDVEYSENNIHEQTTQGLATKTVLKLSPRTFSKWVIAADKFSPKLVGGKSHHLVALRKKLPTWIHTPTSIALPFGCFEQVLADKTNQAITDNIKQIQQNNLAKWSKREQELRAQVAQLKSPNLLRKQVEQHWQQTNLPVLSWDVIWSNIKNVWASKWTERAMLARHARGISDEDLFMAVLIQPIIAADYAFVLHTVNPITGDENQVFGELVLGLGETLVGNFPGRALGFTVDKNNDEIQIVSLPSKNIGLYGESVIFRSDSNGEDLEEYAGAGLYDSVTALPLQPRLLHYTQDVILQDEKLRQPMLRQLAKLGKAVEVAAGKPQDIEGVVQNDTYYLVQTRPQVGL